MHKAIGRIIDSCSDLDEEKSNAIEQLKALQYAAEYLGDLCIEIQCELAIDRHNKACESKPN